MAIESEDLRFRYTVATGPGNSAAQASPNSSTGRYASSTAWAGTTVHDLFDAISGTENDVDYVDYRCVYLYNAHSTLTLRAARAYLADLDLNGDSLAIGVDPTASSVLTSSSPQTVSVANDTSAPSGVTFSSPETYDDGVELGDLAPGVGRALWLRRGPSGDPHVYSNATVVFAGDSDA